MYSNGQGDIIYPEIMVVDDNLENLKFFKEILTDKGYKVRVSNDGSLALTSVRNKMPDLILMDVKMPNIDGYEVCERLKNDAATSEIPVIFVSAADEIEYKIKGFEAGGVDFICKPFHNEEVLTRIKTHLQIRYLQKQLIQAKDKAEAANVVKSRFLANMSHEIRTPMNGILGVLQLLSLSDISKSDREYLKIAEESANYLLNIINDILDYSKIEAGMISINNEKFNIYEMLESVLQPYILMAQNKGIKLELTTDKDIPPELVGDITRIRQIIVNLIGNAIKFTEKGFVKLDVKLVSKDNDKAVIRFDIIDTGIGIAENNMENLFRNFSQIDNSKTRKYAGTGLGLAISKRLTETMNGEIFVRSKLGEGSVFSFEVPLVLNQNMEMGGNDMAEYEAKQNLKKVLVAEDNLLNRTIIKAFLERKNLDTSFVGTGIEVLNCIEQEKYDFIFMDIQMPEMDGIQATRVIRAKGNSIPIIAMTAYAMNEDKTECMEAGMDYYIAKPIKMNELYDIIDNVLNGKG